MCPLGSFSAFSLLRPSSCWVSTDSRSADGKRPLRALTSQHPDTSCACAVSRMKSTSDAVGVQPTTPTLRGTSGGFPQPPRLSGSERVSFLPRQDRSIWARCTATAHSTLLACITSLACAFLAIARRGQVGRYAMNCDHCPTDSISSRAAHTRPPISPTKRAHRRERTRIHGSTFADCRKHDRLQRAT